MPIARPAFKTAAESFPRSGNRELPILIPLSVFSPVSDNLQPEMSASQIETIQSVFIDNSQNPDTLTLTLISALGNQTLVAQPNTQGVYPVMCSGALAYIAASAGGVNVPVIFSNTAKPLFVWGPAVFQQAGFQPAPNQGNFANISAVLAVGGTSQQLTPVNLARKRIIIENPSTAAGQGIGAAESVYVNFTFAAGLNNGGDIEILPSGYFDSGAGPVTTQAIEWIAATTNHRLIAYEM